jgi:hypothetical protein
MGKQGCTLYEKVMKKFLKISSFLEQDGEKKEEEEAKQRAACKNKTFEEFLRKQNLTENLVHFVVYAIAMVRPDTPAEEGLLQTRFVPSEQPHDSFLPCSRLQLFKSKIFLSSYWCSLNFLAETNGDKLEWLL